METVARPLQDSQVCWNWNKLVIFLVFFMGGGGVLFVDFLCKFVFLAKRLDVQMRESVLGIITCGICSLN